MSEIVNDDVTISTTQDFFIWQPVWRSIKTIGNLTIYRIIGTNDLIK